VTAERPRPAALTDPQVRATESASAIPLIGSCGGALLRQWAAFAYRRATRQSTPRDSVMAAIALGEA
jgi:hypothetical protein